MILIVRMKKSLMRIKEQQQARGELKMRRKAMSKAAMKRIMTATRQHTMRAMRRMRTKARQQQPRIQWRNIRKAMTKATKWMRTATRQYQPRIKGRDIRKAMRRMRRTRQPQPRI